MNTNNAITVIVVLILGVGIGYFVGSTSWGTSFKESVHEVGTHDDGEMGASHSHDQMEAHEPVPSVTVEVHEDPKSGWNAQIMLSNFAFAPERVSTQGVAGEGHAHIYVDGVKINRVYGEWYHLGELSPGTHEVSVRLSTNDHKELLHNGELITDTVIVTVSEKADTMQMDSHQ